MKGTACDLLIYPSATLRMYSQLRGPKAQRHPMHTHMHTHMYTYTERYGGRGEVEGEVRGVREEMEKDNGKGKANNEGKRVSWKSNAEDVGQHEERKEANRGSERT